MKAYGERCRELYERLSAQGIRLFDVSIDGDVETYIHPKKSARTWRNDLRAAIAESHGAAGTSAEHTVDELKSELRSRLRDKGYVEIHDAVSDAYEGEVSIERDTIVDAPTHEVQRDGFGHYGFERGEAE